jgi:uncharacterized protein (TIGR00270 family)
MGVCELCGKENTGVFNILVSGAQISACVACSTKRGFSIPSRETDRARSSVKSPISRARKARPTFEAASDFHIRIRKAREANGMSVEELGRKMNLRVQDLQKYEGGSVPPDSIAKKLERELGIVILEEVEANDVSPVVKRSNKSVTITDMLDDLMRDASND